MIQIMRSKHHLWYCDQNSKDHKKYMNRWFWSWIFHDLVILISGVFIMQLSKLNFLWSESQKFVSRDLRLLTLVIQMSYIYEKLRIIVWFTNECCSLKFAVLFYPPKGAAIAEPVWGLIDLSYVLLFRVAV